LHKKLLETDSANPEAEQLFIAVLSLIHHDKRLSLFPKKNENRGGDAPMPYSYRG
jgi:hypothetical protein